MKSKVLLVALFLLTVVVFSIDAYLAKGIIATLSPIIYIWVVFLSLGILLKSDKVNKLNDELVGSNDALTYENQILSESGQEWKDKYDTLLQSTIKQRDAKGKFVSKVEKLKEIAPFKMCVNAEQSEIVQKTLFILGFKWMGEDNGIENIDKPCLEFTDNEISYATIKQMTNERMSKIPEITFSQFCKMCNVKQQTK